MSLFKKLKSMVGITGVKLDYAWIENPFPFNDPMIKATIRIKTGDDSVTVIGKTGTFYAQRTNSDGLKEEIVLGEEKEDVNNCMRVTRNGEKVSEFPDVIPPNDERSYGYFVGDMDLKKALKKWNAETPQKAKENGVKFYFKGEVDLKDTAGLFDPTLEQEITVYDNN